MTAQEMWTRFIALHPAAAPDGYEAWAYGDDPDHLAELTRSGMKQATSSAAALYALDGEEFPRPGEYSVILDAAGHAVCIIRTARVQILPFCAVDARHALMEGEGDRSLAWWREVHERFFRRELARHDLPFTDDIAVVCEEFEVVYR